MIETKIRDKAQDQQAPAEAPPIILKRWRWAYQDHLQGDVYGHPRFPDGENVVTSTVLRIDEMVGIAETKNTVYILRDKA